MMAITRVRGTYHGLPVIFHQEDGQTVKITPGRFCPACHDSGYLDVDEGFRECRKCGRCYFLPSQRQIDAASQKAALENWEQLSSTSPTASGD
jgi:hypothetical protein